MILVMTNICTWWWWIGSCKVLKSLRKTPPNDLPDLTKEVAPAELYG